MEFSDLLSLPFLHLYAGDLPDMQEYRKTKKVGLSLTQSNAWHIRHDVSIPLPIHDETVDIYQAEDVFEHIEYSKIKNIIFDIYRVLKKGGLFRLSVPDYRCDILFERSLHDADGNIFFDPGGGGDYRKKYFLFGEKRVINGGHVWFPIYETVKQLFQDVPFTSIDFLHYYDELGMPVIKKIDYSNCYVQRTPDNDARVASPFRPMSLVVDCIK